MTADRASSMRWLAIGAGALAVVGLGLAGGYLALSHYATRRAESALQQLAAALPPGVRLTWTKLSVDPLRRAATLDDTILTAPQFTVPFGRVTIGDVHSDGDAVSRATLRIEPGAVDLVAFGKKPNIVTFLLGAPLRWSIGAGYDVVEPTIDIGFDYSAADNKAAVTFGFAATGFGSLALQGVVDRATPQVLSALRQLGTGLPNGDTLNALSSVGLERVSGSMEDAGLVSRIALLQVPQTVYTGGDLPKRLREELAQSALAAKEQAAVVRFATGEARSLRVQSVTRLDGAALKNLLTPTPSAQGPRAITISN